MMRVAAAMRKGNLRDLKKLFREDAAIYAKKSELEPLHAVVGRERGRSPAH